jgi:hypothetical protein
MAWIKWIGLKSHISSVLSFFVEEVLCWLSVPSLLCPYCVVHFCELKLGNFVPSTKIARRMNLAAHSLTLIVNLDFEKVYMTPNLLRVDYIAPSIIKPSIYVSNNLCRTI